MINYILRTLVYLQSFLWLFILFSDLDLESVIIDWLFVWLGFFSYFVVLYYGISFSQYTPELLSFYILSVVICYGLFNIKYSHKDSISLAFLIVFINSYYWEIMHHFNAIVLYGLNFNQIVQMFHLIPAYFLAKRLIFHNPKRVKKLLIYGLIISCTHLISLYVFSIIVGSSYSFLTTPITRVLTLGILITIFLDEVKGIKKSRDIEYYDF